MLDDEEKRKNKSVWYYEDILYLCWAWDKELIKRGDISWSVGKSISACKKKVEELKNDGLYEKYKQRFETGEYIGGLN